MGKKEEMGEEKEGKGKGSEIQTKKGQREEDRKEGM